MREIIMNIIEINLIMIPLVLLLYIFRNSICKRYGAKCLRILWILLAIRWIIPLNFSFHVLNIELPGFVMEERNGLTNEPLFNIGEDYSGVNIGENIHNGENLNTGESVTVRTKNEVIDSFDKFIHNPYQVILIGWLLGCSICLMIIIVEYLRFVQSYYIKLQAVTDKKMIGLVKKLEQEFLGHSKIQIFIKQDIISPMLIGCVRPKLILPEGMKDAREVEMVIKHELCHYKNRDLWFKWLVNGTWIMNWFNPCVYLLKKELMAAMELTCDSYALQDAGEGIKEKYARLVLSYADNSKRVHMFGTSFYNGKRNMKKRIDNMMDENHKKKFTGFLIVSILLILSAGLLISCGEKEQNQQQGMDDLQQAEDDRKQMENELQQMEDERQQAEEAIKQAEEELQRIEDERQQVEDTRRQMEEDLQRLEEEARTHMEEASTGMPSGFIEQPQVMYNNSIYYYYATGRDEDLPDGYNLVGTIEKVDSENTPDKDYNAAGVDLYVGQEIYVDSNSPDIIYLKYDTGFGKFMTDYYSSKHPDELNQH